MQKIKALITKYWILLSLIGAILTIIALVKLPNLSNLAIQAELPKTSLTHRAHQITHHWGNNLNDATMITLTYSVPNELSDSQKLRLENKERFLIENKHDLKIYKVTSIHTSPHANHLFNGKNWRKLQIWIPYQLVNSPIYQAQLRHLCSLSGFKTNWENPLNEQYQRLVAQWYQQKIICVWVILINFIILLLITSLTKALLITLANLELSIINLSLFANLIHSFFFYSPLLIILLSCITNMSIMLWHYQPHWLIKLTNPMQSWHPLISLMLLSCLIFPLLSNFQIHFQSPQPHQSVTVYLTSTKSIINQTSLNDLNRLTNALKSLPNVSQVTSLPQPGGKLISKYQLGHQLAEINQNLIQHQRINQSEAIKLKHLNANHHIFSLLKSQTEQLQQLKNETISQETVTNLIQNQITTQTDLTNRIRQAHQGLVETQTKIAENQSTDEIKSLSNLQNHTNHQFYLTSQDSRDTNFSQTCFNYNNAFQTATRIEINLQNGKLGRLPQLIKNQLVGTNFQSKIGMTGIPVIENQQNQQFQQRLISFLLLLSILILSINWLKFKSFEFAIITILLVYLAAAASLGMLAYLTDYQFTLPIFYLMLLMFTLLSLVPSNFSAILTIALITIPFLIVPEFRKLGYTLITFTGIYQAFFPIILQITQQKKQLLKSCLHKILKSPQN